MIFRRRTRYLNRRLGLPLAGKLILAVLAASAIGLALNLGGF